MCVQRVCTMPIFGIGEVMDGAHQEIFRRNEVGVEDGDELALRRLQPFLQRARLEAFAIGAMVIGDRIAQRGIALDQALRDDLDGLVGRIVEHLDIELLARILQLADASSRRSTTNCSLKIGS